MAPATENQFLGALLGMAIGDALGAPVSGLSRAEIIARFGVIDRYRDSALPDATETAPGAFTDETEIALCIAESMTTSGGALDPETAGFRMVRLALGDSRSWLRPDTLAALDRAAESLEFVVPLQEDGPATGDVASRGVPIGLIHAVGRFDADALRRESEAAARLTHGAPAAFNAVTAVAYGVRLAATGAPRDSWLLETADFLGGGELAARLRVVAALGPERSLSDLLEEIGAGLAQRIVDAQREFRVLRASRWDSDVEEQFKSSRYRELPKVEFEKEGLVFG